MEQEKAELLYVTNTIFEQLGGQRFILMTGAHSFVRGRIDTGECFLRFKLPGAMCKEGINLVNITLTVLDVYKVTFSRVSHDYEEGLHAESVCEHDFVYADGLEEIISEVTGLATRVGFIVYDGTAAVGGQS